MTHAISNSLLQKAISLREGIYVASCCSQRHSTADDRSGCSANAECASERRDFEVAKQLKILQELRGTNAEHTSEGVATATTTNITLHKDYWQPRNNSQQQQQLVCTGNTTKAGNKAFSEQRVFLNETVAQRVGVILIDECVRILEHIAYKSLLLLVMLMLVVANATNERATSALEMLAGYRSMQPNSEAVVVYVVNLKLSKIAKHKGSDKYSYKKQSQQHKQKQCAVRGR